jgi:hypothetical protein
VLAQLVASRAALYTSSEEPQYELLRRLQDALGLRLLRIRGLNVADLHVGFPMGRSIRIYLADSEAGGIRHAEIVNWTGQALAFPRNRVSDLKNWPEVRRQGVYFLLGPDEASGQDAVYVGEAESVAERIAQHHATKEFWTECIAFTSKDENLTKSHIKYLESRLVAAAIAAGRYLVVNSSTPPESGLPRADKDAMDEFATSVRTLLGVLGHRVLDPVLSQPTSPARASDLGEDNHPRAVVPAQAKELFSLKVGAIVAKAIRDTDALVVLAGSLAAREQAPSLSEGYKAIREKLINTGILVVEKEHYKFAKEYPFPSPSQAAAVIVGYPINGRASWKALNGQSLKELEEAEAKALGDRLIRELQSVEVPATPE